MRFFQVFLFVILVSFVPFFNAYAQDAGKNVHVRLLAERGAVGGGDEIWVAVEQSIRKDWHTYWKNPGDSGTPMSVEWSLPPGFEMGTIVWPAPHKIPYDPLLNYGYEDHVILLQKLKIPTDLPEGEIVLKAAYEVLVCKEECIPEFGEEILRLNGTGAVEEDNSAYIRKALAKVPDAYPQTAQYYEQDGDFILELPVSGDVLRGVDRSHIEFIPEEWGVIENIAKVSVSGGADILVLSQKRGDRELGELQDLDIVVLLDDRAVQVKAQKGQPGAFVESSSSAGAVSPSGDQDGQGGLLHAVVLAILGGLVLNLMPCVFPVLSMKALSLVKMSEKNPWTARGHGLAYTAGVILSFLVISGILIVLKGAGQEIGWGFQLQDPVVVTILVYLLFVIGLNLSGFFEFTSRFSNVGGALTQGQNFGSSFFTGILATLVAAPCTAPFMGAAISFALGQSAMVGLGVFAALGFGLALPYLVLSFVPALRHMMPKPGAWMDVFKQFLAFPMFASSAWLFWVMSQQAGAMGVLGAGLGLVFIAFGIWLFKVMPKQGARKIFVIILAVLSLLAAFLFLPVQQSVPKSSGQVFTENREQVYSEALLEQYLVGSDPVFVEMTAAWCITCKVNHKTSIGITQTQEILQSRNIQYLVGDWTNQDAAITKYLHRYGRDGVPIYVYYGRPDADGKRPEPVLLPQILTPGIVADYLDK